MRPDRVLIRRTVPRVVGLAALLALAAPGAASANGWEHAGIPYEALIAALGYADPATRKRAAHSLGHRGQKEAVPHLLAALARPEPDHGVRGRIYLALGRLGDPSAAPVLLQCLDRESREELRGDCAWALGGVRGDRERDRLIAVARGKEHVLVRRRAVDALGRYGDGTAVSALAGIALKGSGSRNSLRPHAIAALGATGHADAATPLLTLLERAKTYREALPIVRALGRTGAEAARVPLTAMLDGARDPPIRSALAVALAAVGNRDTVSTLARLLADPSPMVQHAAIQALERRGRSDHAPAVAAYARGIAATLYARIGPERSRDAARTVAEASLLDAAFRTLIALDAARGEDVLTTAARRRDQAGTTTGDVVVANALYRVRRTAIHGLGYTDSDEAAAFLAGRHGLGDSDGRLRAAAVRSIAVLGGPDAVPRILAMLNDSRAEVRMAAARALGRLDDARAVASLIDRLGDRHAQVRRLAVESLGYLGDPAAIASLRQRAAGDGSRAVRKAAGFALSLLGARKP